MQAVNTSDVLVGIPRPWPVLRGYPVSAGPPLLSLRPSAFHTSHRPSPTPPIVPAFFRIDTSFLLPLPPFGSFPSYLHLLGCGFHANRSPSFLIRCEQSHLFLHCKYRPNYLLLSYCMSCPGFHPSYTLSQNFLITFA